MNKNYYYLKVDTQLNISGIKIPNMKYNVIPIAGNDVIKLEFDNGDELLQVVHDGVTEIYASFPIDITAQL